MAAPTAQIHTSSLPDSPTTSTQQSQESLPLIDHIEEFFSYNPPIFKMAKNHSTGKNTRKPAPFDRHFDDHLRLRRIVYLPEITADLAKIAGDAYDKARMSGSLPPISDPFPTAARREMAIGVAPFNRIQREQQIQDIYRITTATFCTCVASTLQFELPYWTQDCFDFTSDTTKSAGIADGFLQFSHTTRSSSSLAGLSDSVKKMMKEFPVLAVWEFKSLMSGSLDVMEAIIQQSADGGGFFWEGCEYGKLCQIHHKGANGLPHKTGYKMGFDAKNHPCSSMRSHNAVEPGPPSCRVERRTKRSAAYIVQQAWAEAVHDDATFIVINAGLFEIIGIRDRTKQTLYISGIIYVNSCANYGKIHTGLYMAAFRDAMDRFSRLELEKSNIPSSWTKQYPLRPTPGLTPKSVVKASYQRDWLVLHSAPRLRPSHFVLDSYYYRANPSKPLFKQDATNLSSMIRIHIGDPIAPSVDKAILDINGVRSPQYPGEFAGNMVVKHASTEDALKRLYSEFAVYLKLKEATVGAIPEVLGLFWYANIEEDNSGVEPCASLVMENVGIPVAQLTEDFSREHLTAFEIALGKIHAAGYIHGNLTRNNLMIRDKSGGVAIVSFGSARPPRNGEEMEKELEVLLRLLPNPLKRQVNGGPTEDFVVAFPTAQCSLLDNLESISHPDSPPVPAKVKRLVI